jgi:hypothetical protein
MIKISHKILIVIIVCQNSMAQWISEYTPYFVYMWYINVLDTNMVWVLGEHAQYDFVTIHRKVDNVWDYAISDLPWGIQRYLSIAGVDSNVCIVGDRFGNVYRVTDNGWFSTHILNAGNNRHVVSIKFSQRHRNAGYIFCSSLYNYEDFIIYKTTNYGYNWITHSVNFGYYISANEPSLWVTDSAHVFCGMGCVIRNNCQGPKIGYTTNGGSSWSSMFIPEAGRYGVSALAFKTDNLTGIAVTYGTDNPPHRDLSLWKTTNGGLNWTFLGRNFGILINPVLINIPGTSVWLYGGDQINGTTLIYKSANDGNSWSLTSLDSIYRGLRDIDGVYFNNKVYAWAVIDSREGYGNYSAILRLIDSVSVIGTLNESSIIPDKFKLLQNFPNPFNTTTKIAYTVPRECHVKILIYDSTGKEVRVIVNDNRNAGYYELIFDGNMLSSGMYYYQLITDNYTETRKMVLIK